MRLLPYVLLHAVQNADDGTLCRAKASAYFGRRESLTIAHVQYGKYALVGLAG
jgi:hypothetical protein